MLGRTYQARLAPAQLAGVLSESPVTEVGEMKAPEAPEEADACVAELSVVGKEMDEYGEGMDIDKACKAFRGFKKSAWSLITLCLMSVT